jgi:hypothetical protein
MEVQYRYAGDSSVSHTATSSQLSFMPDSLRPPTYFQGQLLNNLPFREAMSALHEVVESEMRYQPRDKSDYLAWLAAQKEVFLAQSLREQQKIQQKLTELRDELRHLQGQEAQILAPFYSARHRYFNYLYKQDIDAWYVLDPVITVHPDSIFFECFSQDESSYGKLSCSYQGFAQMGEKACGTTNIDYSHALYQEFQKIRDYKPTQLKVDPSGFEVQTGLSQSFKEEKIDLPDSWVRGFLQVSSAMTLPLIEFELDPLDLYNLLLWLRRHREKSSPRSLRFCLEPGQPIKILLEPWNQVLHCPRSIYQGASTQEVRIWGRRRLFILERLLPVSQSFRVQLLGSGMPSFWTAKMPGMEFTLGLSGWSSSDFSHMGQFDLLAPRAEIDSHTAERIFAALQQNWVESADSLARRLNLDRSTVKAGLGIYAQAGRVLYDLSTGQYRLRELSRTPLPLEQLRFANPREASAERLLKAGLVSAQSESDNASGQVISGEVTDGGREYQPRLRLDSDMRLVEGQCSCHHFIAHHLRQGPCEHMLAIRLANRPY